MADVVKATLGGGCFWCLEAIYQQVQGVQGIVSGYAGGHVDNPSYDEVCRGTTGHAEVVQLDFDPEQVSYRRLLDVFFSIHDPTTRDRQGNDHGPQYRSIILWQDDTQRQVAEECIADLTRERVFDSPIVTEVKRLVQFWPAEAWHQDYFRRNPARPYCAFVIAPKLAHFRQGLSGRG